MERTAAVVMLIVGASGCIGSDLDRPGEAEAPAPIAEGTDCQSTSTWSMHRAEAFPIYPTPWAAEKAASGRALDTLVCSRLSIGTLERGPIILFLEYHDHFREPVACAATDGAAHRFVAHSLLAGDRDVARSMSSALGIEVVPAQGRVEELATDGRWIRWVVNGRQSSIEVLGGTGMTTPLRDVAHRYYWPAEDAVLAIDVVRTARTGEVVAAPSLVAAQSPHIRSPLDLPVAGETFVGSMSLRMEAREWPGPAC